MLDLVSEKIQGAIQYLKGEGSITEKNIESALKDVKLALLSADVHYKVVQDFIARVKEKALGAKVSLSVLPGQQLVKIFNDELTRVLGEENKPLRIPSKVPSFLMLAGLQGVGKTTTAGKLGCMLKKQGFNPLLVSVDLKRPAAQEQLGVIAKESGIPFYSVQAKGVVEAAEEIYGYAEAKGYHPVILDTAGRLHVDEELMTELREVKERVSPFEVVFVADAMTGSDAVKSAVRFQEEIGFDSVILTKLDADSRGGAALSIAFLTGKPIKFAGMGEGYDKLEPFHPERLASRILGMGDIVSLVEKAQEAVDEKEAERLAKKMAKREFSLEDFLDNLKQIKKMGSLADILSHLPQAGPLKGIDLKNLDEKRIVHMEAVLLSMTPEERRDPEIFNGKRRLRVAKGSGRPVSEVNQLLKQYREMKKFIKKGFFSRIFGKVDF